MKFIYTGQLPIKDADLVFAGIFKPNDTIKNGDVFEVPDDNPDLIQRVEISGVYEKHTEAKKVGKPKKETKKEKSEEEN